MFYYEDILRDFQRHKVRYVLVGGTAFNLLGGIRTTMDLDILVEMTDLNLRKLVTVLKSHGYSVRQPVDPMGIADPKIREDWIKNKHMKAFNFYKDKEMKEVDIIIHSPISFEKAISDVVITYVDDLKLPVISAKNLIKMKQAANRDIDQLDIKYLKKIEEMTKLKKKK